MIAQSAVSIDPVQTVECVANGQSGPIQDHAPMAFDDVEQGSDLCWIKLLQAPKDQDHTLRRRHSLDHLYHTPLTAYARRSFAKQSPIKSSRILPLQAIVTMQYRPLATLGSHGATHHVPGGIYD